MAVVHSDSGGSRSITRLETANDRFKKSFSSWLWGGIIVATVIHFGVIRFFPTLTAADVAFGVTELEAIELPPEVEIPPPPEAITRPAVPGVAQTELEEDITIAPTTFEENPVETLPPPPANAERLGDRPVFTPYTVAPRLLNPRRAMRIVEQKYPRIMQQAGIGGTVLVWAFIEADGVVKNSVVRETSGFEKLDEAALKAVNEFAFEPALHLDQHVPVWISMPITFDVVSQ
jgi:TonB family protein